MELLLFASGWSLGVCLAFGQTNELSGTHTIEAENYWKRP